MTGARVVVAVAIVLAAARSTAAADLKPRVLVLPAEGAPPAAMPKLGAEIADALARGAARTTPNVARAESSLGDTAMIVGCDPGTHACLDAVAAALNVDQVLFARIQGGDPDVTIEITAITREAEPQTRRFTIHAASRAADVAALEPAVVEMLDSGEAHRAQAHHDAAPTPTPSLPPKTPPSPPPPAAATTAQPRAKWPVAVTAGGAAIAIAGAGFWLAASSKQSQIDDAPTATGAELDHLQSLETSGRHEALAGNALFVGGSVIAVAGAALWWRAWHTHVVVIGPSVGTEHVGLVVGGRW